MPSSSLRRYTTAVVAVAVVVLVALGALTRSGAHADARTGGFDEQVDCQEVVPAAVTTTGGHRVDALVLVDTSVGSLDRSRAESVLGRVRSILAGAGVDLRVEIQTVAYPGAYRTPALFGWLHQVAGARLASGEVDVVHLLTDADIANDASGTAIDGQADCIGGIRFDHRAYSVAEDNGSVERSARITAHELAHLLGGHHHYAECATGAAKTGAATSGQVCSLLSPVTDLRGSDVAPLNAAVVRGHAQRYGS